MRIVTKAEEEEARRWQQESLDNQIVLGVLMQRNAPDTAQAYLDWYYNTPRVHRIEWSEDGN